MSKFKAIVKGTCPRCRKGKIFKFNATSLSKFHQMNENCPECGLKYEREPGFFVGAMYVNYAFSVAIMVAVGIALSTFNVYNIYTFMIAICCIILVLLPLLFRYSRILFLHWFGGVRHEPNFLKRP